MTRTGLTRTVALLAAGLLLCLAAPALGQTSPRPSGRTPSATPVAAPQVALTITDLLPRAPRPGDPFQVLGTVVNTGTVALKSVRVRVLVGTRIDSRGRLAQADRTSLTYSLRGRGANVADTLAVGADAPVDLRMAVDELGLDDDGIYPLRIQVQALDDRGNRIAVADQNTYLPWFADGKVDPLRLAWVLPLVDQPHRGPDEQFLDDDLAGALAAEGRLGRTLSAGRAAEVGTCAQEPQVAVPTPGPGAQGTAPATPVVPAERQRCDAVPVTYAVDPELLDEAQAMAAPTGYPTARGLGAGTAAATAWLDGLRQAGQRGAGLLALPFADPDVVAMSGGDGTLTADLAAARTYGATLTTELLAKTPLTGVALPPPGPVSDQALDALATDGTGTVILDPAALTADPTLRYTPGARIDLPQTAAGPMTGLVVDAGLSALLQPAPGQSARLAQQRWLVETALIAAEAPNDGRTLLVVPPRRGSLDPAVVRDALLDTGRLPWMCGVALADVVAGTETCPGATGAAPADRT
ncbi:MAG: hypothetical protein JWL64_2373, partial [Frankiales bacterium]|nr:hypothetical protein [Frankiales bacterium]